MHLALKPSTDGHDVLETTICLVCGTSIDPLDPNSIAFVMQAGHGRAVRYAHIAHLPPLGEFEGPEGVVTILGSPLG
jgi:hypothetical protein